MAYDVTLVQVNANIGGFFEVGSNFGFTPGTFDTILFSFWTCLPTNRLATSNGGPSYIFFFDVDAGGGSTTLQLGNMAHVTQFYSATFTGAPANVRANHLISVDCHTQTVQYYVNDVAQSVTSGGWTAVGQFSVGGVEDWAFDIGSSFGLSFPAFADLWFGKTGSFVDLSIEANRRKFINADLTPVDLGSNGAAPFGVAPQIFQTIPSGGVPNAFLTNRGSGGGSFGLTSSATLSFQTPGTCHVPSIVLIPLIGVSATAQVGEFPQFHELKLVSLYPILPSSGDVYGLISDFGADFPTSFGQFSLSVWCCENVNIRGPNSYGTPFSFDMKFTPTMATLQFYDSSNQVLFSGSFANPNKPTNLYHVMFSIDTQAQTYALWIASGAAAIEWATSDAHFATIGGINNVGA